jgi:hypothetical protein
MNTNTNLNDIFGIEAAFKQIADAWNDSIEQAKRQSECRMRRFSREARETNKVDALGVVFPDGTTIIQEYGAGDVHIYDSITKVKTMTHRVIWIDPEVAL